MMVFVFVFDIVQDVQRLLGRGGFEDDFLETAFESTVLFNVLAIFVQRGGTDTLQFTAGEGGFEEVGGIHAAGGVSGAHHGMQFVDEKDDIGVFLQLFEDGLDSLLELSTVFGACHEASHVKADDTFVQECAGDVSGGNLQCKSLCQSGFTDTGLANEHRVVLFSAAEDLGDAFQLFLAAHHGVNFALGGHLGEVLAETVKHGRGRLAVVLALLHGAAVIFFIVVVTV